MLIEELADATLDQRCTQVERATVPLLVIDDLGMRKLPPTAAEDLLELVMRRYERASTLIISSSEDPQRRIPIGVYSRLQSTGEPPGQQSESPPPYVAHTRAPCDG